MTRLSALRTGGLYSSGSTRGTYLCKRLRRPQSHRIVAGRFKSMKNPNDPTWNRTRDTCRLKTYIVYVQEKNVKGKIVPVHATKAYRGSRGIAALS